MKKTLITLTTFVLFSACFAMTACQTANTQTSNLPASIQDPVLLKAWTLLNTLNEPIQLAGEETLTGHDLAQFVVNKNVPIEWDEDNVCSGNSCSLRYHVHGESVFTHDGQPIYIRLTLKNETADQMTLLVETMAHEIYHYTEPFGQVDDSLYEEYLAFNMSARMAHTSGMDDTCANPMLPACLKHWFETHKIMYGYTQVQLYPPSLMASIDTTDQTCVTNDVSTVEQAQPEVATQAPSTANPACTINALGLPDCQHGSATATSLTSTPVGTGSIFDCKTNNVGFIECHYETPTPIQ